MAETKREQILGAARDRIRGITTGNGYRTTVARVLELPVDPDQLTEFPVAVVTEEKDLDETLYEEATFDGQVDDLMHFSVTVFAKGSDAQAVRTLLNRLDADVAKALSASLTLGLDFTQPIRRVARDGSSWAGQDGGWRGWASTTWAVPYTHQEGDE